MRKIVRIVLWTAIIVGTVIGLARLVALRWWHVPSDDPWLDASVAPTLQSGELVLLWRATAPKYGDLVVCPEPGAPERVVIGRIVGEAGDKVKVEGQTLYVNGTAAETERGCGTFEVKDPTSGTTLEQTCHVEVVGGKSHQRGSTAGHKIHPKDFERDVAEGDVWLLSDNRLFPYDSRDFGGVPRESCKESVVFRLWGAEGFFDVERRFAFVH